MTLDSRAEIDRFFGSYTRASERLDADALATHFVFPCQIVAEGEPASVTTIASAQDYVAIITRFLGLYRKADVGSGKIVDLALTTLSARVVSAKIGWQVCDRSGAALYEFESIYTLAKTENGWRIAAIAHNELPQLQAVLAARKPE